MNWFHVKSSNTSINLNLISEICWKHPSNLTRVIYLQTSVPYNDEPGDVAYTDIEDRSDRIALRNLIVGDNWTP